MLYEVITAGGIYIYNEGDRHCRKGVGVVIYQVKHFPLGGDVDVVDAVCNRYGTLRKALIVVHNNLFLVGQNEHIFTVEGMHHIQGFTIN